mmetsp:Transcript_11034/g.24679  ORF Transcript_11034/g.24679 Transcript_11034/m.24679 type:complete len:141 (+) Transcript_11034:179-601(+)
MTHERRPLAVLMSALADQAAAILEGPSNGEGPENQEWWQPKKRKRAVACGRCSSCCRDDCGRCLNCLDKPKFGGNGNALQSARLFSIGALWRSCKHSSTLVWVAMYDHKVPHRLGPLLFHIAQNSTALQKASHFWACSTS